MSCCVKLALIVYPDGMSEHRLRIHKNAWNAMVNVHPAIKDSTSVNSYGLMTIPLSIEDYTIQLLTPHLEGIYSIHRPHMGPIFRHTHRKNQPGKERSKGPHLVAGGSDGISIHSWMRLPLEVSPKK